MQSGKYPTFAMNNTYGIKSVPTDGTTTIPTRCSQFGIVSLRKTVYSHMNVSCHMRNGCLDQISRCRGWILGHGSR